MFLLIQLSPSRFVALPTSKLEFPQISRRLVISVFVDIKSEDLLFTKALPKEKRVLAFQKLERALPFRIID